jgi:hypothetical protein
MLFYQDDLYLSLVKFSELMMKLGQQPWKIDSSIDVNRVSLEDVKLIFGQAEKRLDDTVKTGESIASKKGYHRPLIKIMLPSLAHYIS